MAEVPREIAEELYAAEPQRFVTGRDAAAAAAKDAGDGAAAAAIAALRKPTVAAWLVNLLAIKRPKLLDELVELSAALRAAQRDLRGEQLRQLSGQRQSVITALAAQARDLAVEAQPGLAAAKLPMDDVEATLTAALADEDVAAQVRSGRLVKAVSYSGFGGIPPSQGVDDLAAAPARRGVSAQLRRRLAAARAGETAAREHAEQAAAAERAAAADLDEVEEALAALTDRRSRAKEEWARCRDARTSAQRDLAAAGRLVSEVLAALDDDRIQADPR